MPKKVKHKPGDEATPGQDGPTVRYKDKKLAPYKPTKTSEGNSSKGYVNHFQPDREVQLSKLNKALQDVYGEPGLRMKKLVLEIDEEYWEQFSSDPWSGNIHKWSF